MREQDLPTVEQIMAHVEECRAAAYKLIGDAEDWARSDWSPLGASLTETQARWRTDVERHLAAAKRDLNLAAAAYSRASRE